MNNIKPLIKRVAAYVIDLFVILIIASLVSSIPMLNKNMKEYQKTYDKYLEKYNEYDEYIKLLEKSYEDKNITEEEYNKLIENQKYKEIIEEEYEDKEISKGEYKEIVEEINEEFDEIASDSVYILNKKGVSNSIITLVCTLLYFGVFQYLLKGQTIGKKLLKLQVVPASNKKINILNYLCRSLIVNDVLLNTISILFLVLTKRTIYEHADNVIGILISIVEGVIIFLVLTREDQRGLHDLLFNTKVISTEKPVEESKIEVKTTKKAKKKIIEASYEEGNN